MTESEKPDVQRRDADAIRYVVLRKLASGLRHTLMGELQSIQFLAELGARLLQSGSDETKTRECVSRIPQATSDAITTCHSVIEWLRPDEGARSTLGEAVAQCVKLAGDDWRMRATQATVAITPPAGEAQVAKAAARELIVTSLFVLTDLYRAPLDIEIAGELVDDTAELTFRGRVSSRVPPIPLSPVYHPLGFDDVALLAAAHGVPCRCGDDSATLRFLVTLPDLNG